MDLFTSESKSIFKGNLKKMSTSMIEEDVHYVLGCGDDAIYMNDLIEKRIQIKFDGRINCDSCGTLTKKPYGQGFCYDCFINAPQAAECIVRPELCRAHLGEGRDPEWEKLHHAKPHIVYLAVSSAVKVGITRETQVPTRWIDQGASYAIKIAETPYRQLAGAIEVALKDMFTDKTNWRKMLKNEVEEDVDLEDVKWSLEEVLPADLVEYMTEDDDILHINYPVNRWPDKVNSVNLLKTDLVEGTLAGIKGQYLIFDDNRVMNIRNHTGFYIDLGICEE